MKLNIAYPASGSQKLFQVDNDHDLRDFCEKRIGQEVDASSLGPQWKGYIFRITGGNDKQGFPMKQGVLTTSRVRLLLAQGQKCYRAARDGQRRRKSVRGCIVDPNLSVLSLIIVKRGNEEISGLTDVVVPRRLGPKRVTKIRKLFNLSKEDDVKRFVVKRLLPSKEGKTLKFKAPKIQRLITPLSLQRQRRRLVLKKIRALKKKAAKTEYLKLLQLKAQRKIKLEKEKRKRGRSASVQST